MSRSEDLDPMTLDGVNPREFVSRDEEMYYRDLYGDGLVHMCSARANYERALCGKHRGMRPLKPGAEVTCVVCRDLQKKR